MKVHLLFPDRDFDLAQELPPGASELVEDLGLAAVLAAMAQGDQFLFEVAQRGLLDSLSDPAQVTYRQRVLQDCLDQPETVRRLYQLAVDALQAERKVYSIFRRSPASVLSRSRQVMQIFLGFLRELRQLADQHQATFGSEGLSGLLATLRSELDDDYFAAIEAHLRALELRNGVLLSARFGEGMKGEDYLLHNPGLGGRTLWQRLGLGLGTPYTIEVSPRDEAGARALGELTGQGINLVGNALARSVDHLLQFFTRLRGELGFYIACLNLRQRLLEIGVAVCTPEPRAEAELALAYGGLYDVGLTLRTGQPVVPNDLAADGKQLVMITGANSGGKSTFLRAVGLAQLMLQAGLFVGAESGGASLCRGLFSHFAREEDPTMASGRLDEELSRMSQLADQLQRGATVLFNESFGATNESEGSEIARQIVTALLESGVRVIFVTHLFDLVERFHAQQLSSALFLRAERLEDGQRTFKLKVEAPLPTSFGEDMYQRLGGW